MKTSNRIKLRERMTHGVQLDSLRCPIGFLFPSRANGQIVNVACRLQSGGTRARKDMNAVKVNIKDFS